MSNILLLLLHILSFIPITFSSQQHRQTKQCGLPPNLNELPDFAQDEIRAVWKEYVAGKKCDKEMLITEDILAVLAMFDKELEREGMKMMSGGGEREHGTATVKTAYYSQTTEPTLLKRMEEEEEKPANAGTEIDKEQQLSISMSPTTSPSTSQSSPPPYSSSPSPTPFGPPTVPKGPRQMIAAAAAETSYRINPRQPTGRPGKVPPEFREYGDRSDVGDEEGPADEEVKRPNKERILTEYEDREDGEEDGGGGNGGEGDVNQQFYEPANQLPFLKGAKPSVVKVFRQVLEDPVIPSETRRMEEIHVLAVSYLNARQLAKFNAWSSERRKKIHLREHQLKRPARDALERLAKAADERQRRMELGSMAPELRGELHEFAMVKKRSSSGRGE